MKSKSLNSAILYLKNLLQRHPDVKICETQILQVFQTMVHSLENGGKIIACGNGGSAADSLHFVGELLKGFNKKRELSKDEAEKFRDVDPIIGPLLSSKLQRAIKAIELNSSCAIGTAIINDNGAEMLFAQQVYALGNSNDVFFGISTSGNSSNIVNALCVAKAIGMKTTCLIGRSGGKMSKFSDFSIIAPGNNTPEIQEFHLPIYHSICSMLEEYFFGEASHSEL